ncbi:hypothetical protein [Sinorhizobium saheli]|uniref:hypothetical protein n=1 Tax=Sinorhizobium saheli TaxID=36856 RepID=UPI00129745F7|nr:hypothetical protein [Sinorhizobium saheli]MQW85969.1 hypothetical protein [Sinorhizobium saheli]
MTAKRLRGRPLGSGINDDRFLNEVADLLQANPRLKARAAMRQVITARVGLWVAASEDAMLYRLQVKWRARKTSLLDTARQRAESRERTVTLGDLITVGAEIYSAYRAWKTPENMRKLATAVTEISETANRFVESVAEIHRAMARRGEELQRLVEAARRVEQMGRIQIPRIAQF